MNESSIKHEPHEHCNLGPWWTLPLRGLRRGKKSSSCHELFHVLPICNAPIITYNFDTHYFQDGSSILKGAKQTASTSDYNEQQVDPSQLRGTSSLGGRSCQIGAVPCKTWQYCKVNDGYCETDGMYGVCTRMPDLSFCVYGEDPEVCGCDGVTYLCRMEAERAGVNVVSEGACPSISTAIVNSGSPNQRALDVSGGANSHCQAVTNIELYQQNGQDWQQWIFNDDGSIESVFCPGMVLNIEYGGSNGCAAGSNVILYPKSDVAWEQWYRGPNGMIYSSYCSGMVIEIEGGDDSNGANIQIGYDQGAWYQTWKWE